MAESASSADDESEDDIEGVPRLPDTAAEVAEKGAKKAAKAARAKARERQAARDYVFKRMAQYEQWQRDQVDADLWEAMRIWLAQWPTAQAWKAPPRPADQRLIPTYRFMLRNLPGARNTTNLVPEADMGLAANLFLAMGLSGSANPIIEDFAWMRIKVPDSRSRTAQMPSTSSREDGDIEAGRTTSDGMRSTHDEIEWSMWR